MSASHLRHQSVILMSCWQTQGTVVAHSALLPYSYEEPASNVNGVLMRCS